MSNWFKVQALPPELTAQVTALYGDNFPLVVRNCLSNYIEEWIRKWNESYDNLDIDYKEGYAQEFVHALIREINEQSSKQDDYCLRFQLNNASDKFQNMLPSNSLSLINHIKNCLDDEQRILENYTINTNGNQFQVDSTQTIIQKIYNLREKISNSETDIHNMNQERESINLLLQKISRIPGLINYTQQRQLPVELDKVQKQKKLLLEEKNRRLDNLSRICSCWIDKSKEVYDLTCSLMKIVLDELEEWRKQMILSGNGALFKNNIDKIQEWCESLANIIWSFRQHLERVVVIYKVLPRLPETLNDDIIIKLRNGFTELLGTLVSKTFIVEKQPPQVMKTNTKFQSTVRFLIGVQLGVNMTPPQVIATIINESQVGLLDRLPLNVSSGEIVNNTVLMEHIPQTRQLIAPFRNMTLKKIKRTERKGSESVMDEKFALLFSTTFKIGNGDLVFNVKTLSLPVVVIVHGNQEPHAWATVAWDNAFAESFRSSFNVPEKIIWKRIASLLNMKFKSAVGTDLTSEDLKFLAGKAFRNPNLLDYDNQYLSWSQFSKEPLPERNFTFWEWFYAIIKLTRDHLKPFWDKNNRVIYGFISRENATDLLMKKPHGTFLLRYADSDPGALTIAYVKVSQVDNKPVVLMIKPFSCNDLKIRPLADRINDLKHLTFLYPDIPKDQAFSKYYKLENEDIRPPPNGYIKPFLITQIPWWAACGTSESSYPSTPQSVTNINSPVTYYENNQAITSNMSDMSINMNSVTSIEEMEKFIGIDCFSEVDFMDY